MSQVLGVQEIREIVPARKGMLLLDKVYVESETKAWGLKSISMGETFFLGHFTIHPIFPGVL
ncbi:MAG: 3-hydroxyacyl-[acyl-carrier-protein] dehydratase FabZ, partial [Lentisphaeria bacterium]|nr:3-hydroxyacyl-[acyl-carrier-protein] dehydratase FabZ [Lentisphaeria bacterium]